MNSFYYQPELTSIIEYLEQLEDAFSRLPRSISQLNTPLEALSCQLQSTLGHLENSVQAILTGQNEDHALFGLDRLWLKSLLKRCDSIKSNVNEAGSFYCWIAETHGVEIWWILRHGIPSLKQIKLRRNQTESSGLDALLKNKNTDPLAAMRDLAKIYKQASNEKEKENLTGNSIADLKCNKDIAEFENLAGKLILIAVDQDAVKSSLSEDEFFMSIIMESLSCDDTPRIFFLEIVEQWLPLYSQPASYSPCSVIQRDNFIDARLSSPEKRFRSLADALAA